jgi:hypothetical protein
MDLLEVDAIPRCLLKAAAVCHVAGEPTSCKKLQVPQIAKG